MFPFPRLSRRRPAKRHFARDLRGFGAVEFTLTLPMVLTVFVGCVEYVRYTVWARHAALLADTAAELISTKTSNVVDTDISFAWRAALAILPDAPYYAGLANKDWSDTVRVRVSSATVSSSTARVDWSAGASGLARACGKLTAVADSAANDSTSVPKSLLGVPTFIIADVEVDFTPMIATTWIPRLTIRRSAYFVPRTLSSISYTPTSLGYTCS